MALVFIKTVFYEIICPLGRYKVWEMQMEASAKDTMTETEKERQTVNKTLKGELAKLKEMTWGQKAEYIWDYYKNCCFK